LHADLKVREVLMAEDGALHVQQLRPCHDADGDEERREVGRAVAGEKAFGVQVEPLVCLDGGSGEWKVSLVSILPR
jgi:hypothetical protein